MTFSWGNKSHSPEANAKRKKTVGETMIKKKIEKGRQKNAWYCQICGKKYYTEKEKRKPKGKSEWYCQKCGEKHSRGNLKFSICEECFRKLILIKEKK